MIPSKQSSSRSLFSPLLRSRTRGFTLVELLTVLGIVAVITAVSVPSMSSLLRSNQLDQSVGTLSGLMERARQVAISDNSYVWVAFTDNPGTSSPAKGVSVVVLESLDGTDALNNFTVGTSSSPIAVSSATNLRVLSHVQNMPGINITNEGAVSFSSLPSATVTPASLQGSTGTKMGLTINSGSNVYTFTRGIEYAPNGEAKIATWNNLVEFGVESSVAATSPNVSVIRVSTLTGKLTVYRP